MTASQYWIGNKFVSGSTQSGKSYAEVHDVLAAEASGRAAIVVIDPHRKSLAWNTFVQLNARGVSNRILFDQLTHLDRTLGYRFIRPSRAREAKKRASDRRTWLETKGDEADI